MSEIQGYHIQEQWRHQQDHVSRNGNRHWKPPLPPIPSKPYTLPLKQYKWVQREIETLEKAEIIERSISPWASPVVIIPKKSTPGEPPRRSMCMDYRRINKLQPEVTKANGGKGCISLIPLPKIDELYAKLKGYKVFSCLDLRSGYYHIGLSNAAKNHQNQHSCYHH